MTLEKSYDNIGISESWLDNRYREFLSEYEVPGDTLSNCNYGNKVGSDDLIPLSEL